MAAVCWFAISCLGGEQLFIVIINTVIRIIKMRGIYFV